jgi:capsular exopolysaccharide synthesis family protein
MVACPLVAGEELDDKEPELARYLRIVVERRWWVAAVVVLGVAAFLAWASRQERVYQATGTIIVEPSPPQVLGGDVRDVSPMGPGQYYAMQDYLQTQRRLLLSDALARQVVARLKLDGDRAFFRDPLPASPEDAAERFAAGVTAEIVLDTEIIAVSFRHPVPAQAKRAVDGLIDAYLESNLAQRESSNGAASRWLANESDLLRARLGESELQLYDFKRKNDLLSVSLEDRINNVTRQIDRLSDALTEVRLRKLARGAEADELARMTESDPDTAAPTGAPNALASLKNDLIQEERKLSELRARYADAHPQVVQQAAKVATVQSGIAREVAAQLRGARARTTEAAVEEKKIAAELEAAKQEGLRVTRLEVEYNKLKRESEALGRQYALVQNRTKETELASKVKVNNLRVLDYARLPKASVSPHLVRAGLLAIVASLVLAFLLALLLDALDRTLKSQEDVEAKLGLPFLGVMPRVSGGDLEVADNPSSAAAECCRLVRTNLMFVGLARPLRRLLVTSPIAREGKTLTTVSLGVVMAQAGTRVLLIDSDLRRPRLKSALGLDGELGLTSVLLGAATLEQAIVPTRIPNLYALPSGPVPPNPAELVDGPRFREVLDECSDKFERVILDSPPAVLVTDPAILAGSCDGVVLVVRSGRTAHHHARRARRNLGDVGARILGVVLNDCDLRTRGYGGYGYGYGYYRTKRASSSSEERARG